MGKEEKTQWHAEAAETVAQILKTDPKSGLTKTETDKRFRHFGPNLIKETKKQGLFGLFVRQFESPLVLVLVAAGIITFSIGHLADTIVIAIVILVNAFIGTVQEEKSSKIFNRLRSAGSKTAVVIRDGTRRVIPADEVVPGDIILVSQGEAVPADARLIEARNFLANESALTGEWLSVIKHPKSLPVTTAMHQQSNMVFMGTLAASGTAQAVAVATGSETEIGRLAGFLDVEPRRTPLERKISRLATSLGFVILTAVAVIFVLGLARGIGLVDTLLLAVSIGVAALPSGLPIAVTVTLAVALQALLAERGLVKNLAAAETLGSATVILTDKTGTLTEAKIQVGEIIPLEIEPAGKRRPQSVSVLSKERILTAAILSSEAFIEGASDKEGLSEIKVSGRPIERAVALAGIESGIDVGKLLDQNRRLDIFPFSTEDRFAAGLYREEKGNTLYVSGAPEVIIASAKYCRGRAESGKCQMTKSLRRQATDLYEKAAASGLRVIAVASANLRSANAISPKPVDNLRELVFEGLIGLHDPLRSDAAASIAAARAAGARVIIATGDGELTARRVAAQIGLMKENDVVINGEEVERATDEDLSRLVRRQTVFARALPHQKLRLLKALQRDGEIVAMTGDGVNDAPALVSADIGVALGSGTEVAKEAADLVLLDDNFSVIVSAIKEGRRVLDNIRKILVYLLSTSGSEVLLIGAALVTGLPAPLLPAQILWANLVEEGVMTTAFAFEPADKGVMTRRRRHSEPIVSFQFRWLIAILAGVTSIFSLLVYLWIFKFMPIEKVRSIIFAVISFDSLFFSLSLKNLTTPFWKANLLSNRYLILALMVSVGTIVIAFTVPFLRTLLSLTPLGIGEWFLVIGIGIVNLLTIEIAKFFLFRSALAAR